MKARKDLGKVISLPVDPTTRQLLNWATDHYLACRSWSELVRQLLATAAQAHGCRCQYYTKEELDANGYDEAGPGRPPIQGYFFPPTLTDSEE